MTSWPYPPNQMFSETRTYMVTGATYQKIGHFNTPERLKYLHDSLLELAKQYEWELQAWAVFANHYHFIGVSPETANNLPGFLKHLHVNTAKYLNQKDDTPDRSVWGQYWDSQITFQNSYYAGIKYVNQNAVRHGLVNVATDYPWCSASWFEQSASASFKKTVEGLKIDKVKIIDDF